ncbi:DUF317 domain-containing protein [Actinacidiphila sp. bgisy144]|uniref:DUF317 domain-containing protein n=1 Tax=Actinacidiphila sp. bgisy144 TaxID=3413791 RepID=UPI003EBDDE0C
MNSFSLDDRVLVSPRYLAGAGPDRIGDALGPLIHLFGWLPQHDTATGHVSITSPGGTIVLDFDPSDRFGRWWTISHHDPYWTAEFSRQTPIEAVAAVTQVLPQMIGDRRHSDQMALTTSSLMQIAELSGWNSEEGTHISPDGHCRLHHTSAGNRWKFQHDVYEGFDTQWDASFTGAPHQLVAHFLAHLASSAPVERRFGDVPFLVQNYEGAHITAARGTATPPQIHHAVSQLGKTTRRI